MNANAAGPTPGFPAPGWGPAFNPNAIQQLGSLPPGTLHRGPGRLDHRVGFQEPAHRQDLARRRARVLRHRLGPRRDLGQGLRPRAPERRKPPRRRRPRTARLLDPNSGSPCYGASPISDAQNRINPNYGRVTVYTSDARSDYKAADAVLPEEFRDGIPLLRLGHARLGLRHRLERAELRRLHALGRQQPRAELGPVRPRHQVARRGERLVRAPVRERRRVLVRSLHLPDRPPYTAYTGGDDNKDGIVDGPRHDRRRRRRTEYVPPARLLHGGRAPRRWAFGWAPARSRCSSTSSTSRTRATVRRP